MKEMMIFMIVTHFYSLIYREGVTERFITNRKNKKEYKICKKRHTTSLRGYKAEKSKVKQPDGNSLEYSKVNVNCAAAK